MKRGMVLFLTLVLVVAMAVTTADAQGVHIPDDNLAHRIRRTLGLGEGAPITAAAMRELTSFSTRGAEIAELTGLQHATQLTRLDLSGSEVPDISVLANLTKLETLDLDTTVSDISVLANLTKLETLELSGPGVSDISVLANLTKLETLGLSGPGVSDISVLANLTKLETLDLAVTRVSDISVLANLTKLETLDLAVTRVSDISALVNLPQLKELNLSFCPLSRASHTHVLALRQRGVTVEAPDPPPPPPPPPPPTWTLEDSWSGPVGDRFQIVEAIAFAGNNTVFWASGDRLYKWDFEANYAWWWDFDGRRVIDVAISRDNPSVVAYALQNNDRKRDWVSLRKTADLSWVTSTRQAGVKSLSIDRDGSHLAVLGFWNYATYDIRGVSGWQFDRVDGADTSATGAIALDVSHVFGTSSSIVRTFYTRWGGNNISVSRYYDGEHRYLPDISVAGNAFTSGPLAVKDGSEGGLIAVAADARIYFFTPKTSTPTEYTVHSIGNEYYQGHERGTPITCLAVMAGDSLYDSLYYATSTAQDNLLCFWRLDTGALAKQLDVGFRSAEIAFSQHNSYIAVANGSISGGDRSIKIYRWSGDDPGRLAAPAQKTELSQPTALLANYPNPFNPETWIPYQLSEPAEVSVSIYSVDGKLVRTLELGQVPSGVYSDKERAAYWDGRNAAGEPVASGVYFYTLRAGDFSATRKMVIRK